MRLFAGTPWDLPPTCDRCGRMPDDCDCPLSPPPLQAPGKQTACVRLEKRKKGKQVTTVRGLDPGGDQLASVLRQLKDACGAGGTVKESAIEIPGDHVGRVTQWLRKSGFRIR